MRNQVTWCVCDCSNDSHLHRQLTSSTRAPDLYLQLPYWTYAQPAYLQLNSRFPLCFPHQTWSFLMFLLSKQYQHMSSLPSQKQDHRLLFYLLPCHLHPFIHQMLSFPLPSYLLNASRWHLYRLEINVRVWTKN